MSQDEMQKADQILSDATNEASANVEASQEEVAENIENSTPEEVVVETINDESVAVILERAEKRSQENPQLKWYIVNCHSGFEKRAKHSLQEKIGQSNQKEQFGEILIPVEAVVELVKGKKKSSERKFFPGYMLVQMVFNDETWHVVKSAHRVSGFVGNVRRPPPVPQQEVERITKQMIEGAAAARPKFSFKEGDNVRVVDGPFSNFNGTVEEVNNQKSKLRVLVSIFGRATPVELDFIQVKKN